MRAEASRGVHTSVISGAGGAVSITREALAAAVAQASREELPELVGVLAVALVARLMTPEASPAPSVTDPETNVSVNEAARRLGVSNRWVYKNAKRLPFVRRIGRRVVCSAKEVAEWNARQRA